MIDARRGAPFGGRQWDDIRCFLCGRWRRAAEATTEREVDTPLGRLTVPYLRRPRALRAPGPLMLDQLLALDLNGDADRALGVASPRPRPRLVVAPAPEPESSVDELPVAPGQSVLFGDLAAVSRAHVPLHERFGVPPFSVLDARAGYWQRRKAEWLALGIQSELGRGDGILWGSENLGDGRSRQTRHHQHYAKLRRRQEAERLAGEVAANSRKAADLRSNLNGAELLPEWATSGFARISPGTSVFDPVLCELAYRWFLPSPGSTVLDPFAGGSVRGVVAATLGYDYVGIDLSEPQVEANRVQAETIVPGRRPTWIRGDSRDLEDLLPPGETYDLVFSCPPYFDLEVYSDDPADLSLAGSYDAFLEGYAAIISAALGRLRRDRFAVFVVGEVRDKRGMQRGLVSDTVRLFRDAGAHLYNEAIYLQQPGTVALRAPRAMDVARKLGRAHQAVLVFWKGSSGPRWSPISTPPEAAADA